MTDRVSKLLPLACFSLLLSACGGVGEGESADAGEFGDDTGETGDDASQDSGEDGNDAGADTGSGEDDGTSGEDDGGQGAEDGELPPDDGVCDSQSFALDKLTPNVMLVLDKSGSMNQSTWDDDGDIATDEVTRWASLHGVVTALTSKYEDTMNVGLTLFPSITAEVGSATFEGACMVSDSPEVPVGGGNASQILAALPAADDLDFAGATPATAGILTAVTHLEALDPELPRAMIFVTDGAANCASPDNFVSEYDVELPEVVADAWKGAGIPTYVVGIDISTDGGAVDINPRDALHEVALAGGVPRDGDVGFYDASSPGALSAALAEITNRVGCQIELDFDPHSGAGMIIEVDGHEFGELDSCETGDGWIQIDPEQDPALIELCNAACELVAEAGAADAISMCE